MRAGIALSVLFHAALVALAAVSLPESLRPKLEQEPFVPFEVIRDAELADTTNVTAEKKADKPDKKPEPPKQEPKPEPKPEPPIPAEDKPEPKPQPKVAQADEPPPAPPAPDLTPEPEKKPEKKPEPKPEAKPEPPKLAPKPVVKPKPKQDELDFAALAGVIDKAKKDRPEAASPRETPKETPASGSEDRAAVGTGDRITASDVAKMKAAMRQCWSPPVGAPSPEKLIVRVAFSLNRDGTLNGQPKIMNQMQIQLSGNGYWNVAAQNALRAVLQCQPYAFLPAERYSAWKDWELTFDPREMAGL